VTDLGTPNGTWHDAAATVVNDQGVVAGGWSADTYGYKGFVWQQGTFRAIDGTSEAINGSGTVAGTLPWHYNSAAHRDGTALPYLGGRNGFPGPRSYGHDINSAGTVVGESTVNDGVRGGGAVWFENSAVNVGTLGGMQSSARAINDRDEVVGDSTLANGDTHAFLWRRGRLTDLGTLGGHNSHAVDINNNGQVVGTSVTATGDEHAFRWHHGHITDLGTIRSDTASSALAINDAGQVLVSSNRGVNTPTHGFLWNGGQRRDLGGLGGRDTTPTALNNLGQVAGRAALPNGNTHAFRWSNGAILDLSTPDVTDSEALDLNNTGLVVGRSSIPDSHFHHAFIWRVNRP